MIFKKKNPKTYCNFDLGLEIKDCQYYALIDEEENIGHFHCTQNKSVGIFKDSRILIDLSKDTFANKHYSLRNLNNSAFVGNITISNNVVQKSLKTEIEIIHQEGYKWQVIDASKGFSLFTSKTWSRFSSRLYNNKEEAVYMWDFHSDRVYAHRLENLPVTGQVRMTNQQNHLLLFSGLFLMEMELQMKAVD